MSIILMNKSEQETVQVLLNKSQQLQLVLQNGRSFQFSPWFERYSRKGNRKLGKVKIPNAEIRTAFNQTIEIPLIKKKRQSPYETIRSKDNKKKRRQRNSDNQGTKIIAKIVPLNVNWESKKRFLYNPYNPMPQVKYSRYLPKNRFSQSRECQSIDTQENKKRENMNLSTIKTPQIQQRVNIVSLDGVIENQPDKKDRVILKSMQKGNKTSKNWNAKKIQISLDIPKQKNNLPYFVGLIPTSPTNIYNEHTERLQKISLRNKVFDISQYINFPRNYIQ